MFSPLRLNDLQAQRAHLMSKAQRGMVTSGQLAMVERDLLLEVGKAVASGEFDIIVDGAEFEFCCTCNGTGLERTTRRVVNRYVDGAVHCTECDGAGRLIRRGR